MILKYINTTEGITEYDVVVEEAKINSQLIETDRKIIVRNILEKYSPESLMILHTGIFGTNAYSTFSAINNIVEWFLTFKERENV